LHLPKRHPKRCKLEKFTKRWKSCSYFTFCQEFGEFSILRLIHATVIKTNPKLCRFTPSARSFVSLQLISKHRSKRQVLGRLVLCVYSAACSALRRVKKVYQSKYLLLKYGRKLFKQRSWKGELLSQKSVPSAQRGGMPCHKNKWLLETCGCLSLKLTLHTRRNYSNKNKCKGSTASFM
jgi:hypothetical protein